MRKSLFFLLFVILLTTSAFAQRINYQALVNRAQSPTLFINDMLLPGEDGKTTLVFTFRFNNDFLPYKKLSVGDDVQAPAGAEFYTTVRLNSEIFMGDKKDKLASTKAASRDQWSDTLFTDSFEKTQSGKYFASGSLSTQLEPGLYNYVLQLTLMQETNERSTRRQNVHVENLSTKETGEIFWVQKAEQMGTDQKLTLINMDYNVPFGENFYALVRIPDFTNATDYTVEVHEVRTNRKDTVHVRDIYSGPLRSSEVSTNSTITLTEGENPSLHLSTGNYAYTYALVQIPNSTFQNSAYKLLLTKSGAEEPVAEEFFRSYWPDMPASLYNLDIALDNLKFIVSDKELKQLTSGNDMEKREKFRNFWETKDPTPNTVYNELMAEYYRRVDYAYKEFRSEENPMGHESDQGEIYIKYGPPDSKERLFPTNNKVREIWTYGNRKFVFETSTGFGDFVLLGSS